MDQAYFRIAHAIQTSLGMAFWIGGLLYLTGRFRSAGIRVGVFAICMYSMPYLLGSLLNFVAWVTGSGSWVQMPGRAILGLQIAVQVAGWIAGGWLGWRISDRLVGGRPPDDWAKMGGRIWRTFRRLRM